jgi:hypothetical protein
MHINVDNAIIYYPVSQGDDIATLRYPIFTTTWPCVTKMTDFASCHNNACRLIPYFS